MQRILSTQLAHHIGGTVTVAGWVHRRRLLKSVAFLIVRDAAGFTQVVVPTLLRAAETLRGERRRGDRHGHCQRGGSRGGRAHRS